MKKAITFGLISFTLSSVAMADEMEDLIYQIQYQQKQMSQNQYPQPKAYAVYDFSENKILESKNIHQALPIASLTKLMTAHVFLDLNQNNYCQTQITAADTDKIKGTQTRLPKHQALSCQQLLQAMLVGSDNYAASALANYFNKQYFVQKMNQKAKTFGMTKTRFVDSSGLSPNNVASVADLIQLSAYSINNETIRHISSSKSAIVQSPYQKVSFRNTNKIIREGHFDGLISKTGYIREAGYNLVFVNRHYCDKGRIIGVISLNNSGSEQRAQFTMNKLRQYGCV